MPTTRIRDVWLTISVILTLAAMLIIPGLFEGVLVSAAITPAYQAAAVVTVAALTVTAVVAATFAVLHAPMLFVVALIAVAFLLMAAIGRGRMAITRTQGVFLGSTGYQPALAGMPFNIKMTADAPIKMRHRRRRTPSASFCTARDVGQEGPRGGGTSGGTGGVDDQFSTRRKLVQV